MFAAPDCLEVSSVLSNNGCANPSGAEGNEHVIGDRSRFLQIISFSLPQLGQHLSCAQELGISLAEVGSSLSGLPEGRPPSRKDWERISRKWAVDLDRRIAALQGLRNRLAGCIGCGCLSIDRCAIFNAGDHLAAKGTGPILLRSGSADTRNS